MKIIIIVMNVQLEQKTKRKKEKSIFYMIKKRHLKWDEICAY